MTFVLLTGAGFSRNWGGWLANEAFEYLLGCPELDANLRHLLWKSKTEGGGFEDALAHLQQEFNRSKSPQAEKPLRDLEAAIFGMFNAMNQAFARTMFEPQHELTMLVPDKNSLVRTFLANFDAIFTLNQDLLLERHYLDDNINLGQSQKWRGWQIPGMKPLPNPSPVSDSVAAKVSLRAPDPTDFTVQPGQQPYFKLHGSSNWLDDATGTGRRLLIMGGNKAVEINQYPILNWYHKQFKEYLARPGTRLMVIGYSFGDHHINEVIGQAADKGGFRLFIIDPAGVDVLDKQNPRNSIRVRGPLQERLEPHVFGASRRPLSATFGNDPIEHNKVMRFFAA
jgi:hypothetical protein